MNKKLLITIIVVVLGTIAVLGYFFLGKNKGKVSNPTDFVEYISAHTSGVISKKSVVMVRFTESVMSGVDREKVKLEDVFDISPSVDGQLYWADDQTIEFKPETDLNSNTHFTVSLHLDKLFAVKEGFEEFVFEFYTIRQNFEINIEETQTIDKKEYKYQKTTGYIQLADIEPAESVQKILKVKQNGAELNVKWSTAGDNRYFFEIDSIQRGAKASSVDIKWNGDAIDVDKSGEMSLVVPALTDFLFLDYKVVNFPEQHLKLQFSDPLDEYNDLSGLIAIGQEYSLRFSIDGNVVRIYPAQMLKGTYNVTVSDAVKNTKGKKLGKEEQFTVTFEDIKPQVRLVSSGVILPSSSAGLVFPFESVNLKAVDVRVIRIYENNISQFLQVNDLQGQYELRRVGKIVLQKTIPLDNSPDIDLGKWNRFTLDLNELIQAEPGAIYRVSIGFRKIHSVYGCASSSESDESGETANNDEPDYEPGIESSFEAFDTNYEYSYWDYYDDYYYYDDYWSNRDNPCHRAYYGPSKSISQNIIASNIGMLAKKGNDGSLVVFVTDLLTAKPLSDVEVEVYDFPKQLLVSGKTDADGKVVFDKAEEPFLLVAKKGDQRGYLKLADGLSMSLSAFNVSGASVVDGLKGFLYGERGVWRPGDSLYLTFILEENGTLLPENHPVVFELRNPNNQLVKRMVQKKNKTNFYSFHFNTDPEAPTGYWNAKVIVGGATFNKTLRIETIKPNRLKIKLDFGKDKLVYGEDLSVTLSSTWLHGAIAKNLDATVDATLNPIPTRFGKYDDYDFDDPTKKYYPELTNVFDGKLNEEGTAVFNADLDPGTSAPGFMKATFVTKVFEKGGDFSIDQISIPYYPYESYVGIKLPKGDKARGMLLTDTTHTVEMLVLDANGKPVPASHEIEMQFYKLDWRWWWDQSDEYLTNYNGRSYVQPIARETIKTVNGKAKWKIRINYPDWGRYLVRAEDKTSGHSTGKIVYIDWPGWASRESKDHPGAATMLSFSTDKEKYNVGENVQITIPSSEGSRALVTIENGTKVLETYWVEGQANTTNFSFKVTPEMTPNIYVYVTLLQPHEQTLNDLPIRLYGVVPLTIEDPETHLYPVISMPDKLRAESDVQINVSEQNGKAMTYTIAIVDEGLLDLTRFGTPDPWSIFFAKEALGVTTWDLFDWVIGAFGGELERILAVGGDEDAGAAGNKKANRFKPMVRFIGPFELKAGKTDKHTVHIPNYIGSVRTMVVAGGKHAYGSAEKTTPVTKPLMVLATLPRVLGPGEKVKLPVTLFAMENHIKNVQVSVKSNGLLLVDGNAAKTVSFSQTGEELVEFDLSVANKIGLAKIEITAVSGKEKASYEIELDVRNPNPEVTDVFGAMVEPGKTESVEFVPVGMQGTNKATIEFSAIPPLNLQKRLKYLIAYPHGCVEQTTSSVFPQLYLADLISLNQEKKDDINRNVKHGIERLSKFQTYSGGLSYWIGGSDVDDWGTSYAGHFLCEAKKKGYIVPEGFFGKWKKYQQTKARKWTDDGPTSQYIQAYRLYTLALAGSPEVGAMNKLKERKNLSSSAQWRLAAAYFLAGKKNIALKMVEGLSYTVPDYRELAYTYGSGVRDESMILETLSLLGKRKEAFSVLKEISNRISTNEWFSTQTTAYALIAVSQYVGEYKPDGKIKASYRISGSNWMNVETDKLVAQQAIESKYIKPATIDFKNEGGGMLFARVICEGIPEPGAEADAESNLRIQVNYKLLDGTACDPSSLEQGTDFIAEIKVTNPSSVYYQQLALTEIFPSGWEIINTRLLELNAFPKASYFTNQDIRDDRVYTYFNLTHNETKTFYVLLNSSYAGKYYLPAISCEAMYDASIYARKQGEWIEVTGR